MQLPGRLSFGNPDQHKTGWLPDWITNWDWLTKHYNGPKQPPAVVTKPGQPTVPALPATKLGEKPLPLKGMGDKPFVIARLDNDDVIHGHKLDGRVYTASVSKMALADYLRDQIKGTSPDMRRCLSESHAGMCEYLAAKELHRQGKISTADLNAAKAFSEAKDINAQAIYKLNNGLRQKIDGKIAPLVNEGLQAKLGLNTTKNPDDISKSYFSNPNGGYWLGEQPSRITPSDMTKLMRDLWRKDKGEFLTQHGNPNGGWTHTAHSNVYSPTHMQALGDANDQKKVWFLKSGSIREKQIGKGLNPIGRQLINDGHRTGIYSQVIGFNDNEGRPHVAYFTGASVEELHKRAKLAVNSVWRPEAAAAPRQNTAPAPQQKT